MKITYYIAMIYQYQATLQNLHDVLSDIEEHADVLEGPSAEEVEKDLLYIHNEMLKVTGIVKEVDELIEDLVEIKNDADRRLAYKDLQKLEIKMKLTHDVMAGLFSKYYLPEETN